MEKMKPFLGSGGRGGLDLRNTVKLLVTNFKTNHPGDLYIGVQNDIEYKPLYNFQFSDQSLKLSLSPALPCCWPTHGTYMQVCVRLNSCS